MSKAIQLKNVNNEKIYPCPYFPIGSIYMNVNNINPSTIFGGSWEKIEDRFLLSSGSKYKVGNIGGKENHYHRTNSHAITIEEMPSHNHGTTLWNSRDGGNYSRWSVNMSWERNVAGEDALDYWVGATNKTGHGKAHSHGNTSTETNMPPYLVVNIWKRVK